MQHQTFSWQTNNGLKIFAQSWLPSRLRAVISLVHGLGEHSGRYAKLVDAFNGADLGVMTFDHRGHGQSEGKRGHIPGYEAFMVDIARCLDEVRQRLPDSPQILYGHSMGGNLVLNYVLRRQPHLAGVIVTAPWLRLTSPLPTIQLRGVHLMDRLWPSLCVHNRLDPETLSRDALIVEAYKKDPLVHFRISMRLLSSIDRSGMWALTHAPKFSLPLLLIHGSADRLTSAEASREFAQQAPDCTFELWPNLYHEPHNEPEQQQVFEFVIGWIEDLLASISEESQRPNN